MLTYMRTYNVCQKHNHEMGSGTTGGANRNHVDRAKPVKSTLLERRLPMSQFNQDEDFAPVPVHEDLEALMARGRRMRSEAFITGLNVLFHAPGKALDSAKPKGFAHGARKTHA